MMQEEFQDAGGNVALGSDQSPGNNCHNIWNEMKLTSLFNKIKNRDPTAMPCWKSLRMATIEGANAIGIPLILTLLYRFFEVLDCVLSRAPPTLLTRKLLC